MIQNPTMNFEDFIISPPTIACEKWQIGSLITTDLDSSHIALLFVSDYRGANQNIDNVDFSIVRESFYRLSKLDFDLKICDLGDLVSGKTTQDTHYILQEVLSACHYKNILPVIIGGSADLTYSLFSALNFHQKKLTFTQIASQVFLYNEGEEITEKNYLAKILGNRMFSIKNFHLLGYQKHLNDSRSVDLIKDVHFDMVRLAEMMNDSRQCEPFFRKANVMTLNCDAVESFGEAFSIHPQVNGLNRREICAYMKEAGLSEELQSVGIFNFNFEAENTLNYQLLAQMVWYLVEGVCIQKTHPKDRKFQVYHVLVDDETYEFKRENFSDLWYFGDDGNIENCTPCTRKDFDNAKKGILNERLLRR